MLSKSDFHRIVREERLFCSVLAHLLMERGPNLEKFLEAVNGHLPDDAQLPTLALDGAQIYVEFSFLRDYWNSLGHDNDKKRELISTLLANVERLSHHSSTAFSHSIPEFNAFFMGDRGRRIEKDIVYPGQWSVAALGERFRDRPGEFREFCRFKWAFNIKPDIVVLVPHSKPLCIEAKLESNEGQYPTSSRERALYDGLFGPGKGRVGQIELQRFMFAALLQDPCESVMIGRSSETYSDVPCLAWKEVLERLDVSSSIGYVRRIIEENEHLRVPVSGNIAR